MDPKSRLTNNLVAESEAYGYTLTIWGAGAMLIDQYGTTGLFEVFLYVGGALAGFGTLSVVAFDSIVTESEEEDSHVVVVSMIHVVATMGNLLVSYLLIRFASIFSVPYWTGYPIVSFQATVTYNLLLLLETSVSRLLVRVAPLDLEESE